MQPELIPDSIFYCLQYFIPLLLIVKVSKGELPYLNTRVLIITTNITILIAALLTLCILIFQTMVGLESGVEASQNSLLMRFIGPFSMFAWLTLLSEVVLPQMMWNSHIRRSISSAVVWLVATLVFKAVNVLLLQYVVDDPTASWAVFYPNKHLLDYVIPIPIFLLVMAPVYIVVYTRKQNHRSATASRH